MLPRTATSGDLISLVRLGRRSVGVSRMQVVSRVARDRIGKQLKGRVDQGRGALRRARGAARPATIRLEHFENRMKAGCGSDGTGIAALAAAVFGEAKRLTRAIHLLLLVTRADVR